MLSENCTRHTYFLRLLCDALQQREAKDVNESMQLSLDQVLLQNTGAASVQCCFYGRFSLTFFGGRIHVLALCEQDKAVRELLYHV